MRLAAPRDVSTIGLIQMEILIQWRYRGLTRIAPITLFLHVGQEADGHRGPSPHTGFAELLLSAKKGHLQWNGLIFVRKSLLQKPKLVRQLLQRRGCKLLSCMLLFLKPVFCSNAP